jgi:hypothetical protein
MSFKIISPQTLARRFGVPGSAASSSSKGSPPTTPVSPDGASLEASSVVKSGYLTKLKDSDSAKKRRTAASLLNLSTQGARTWGGGLCARQD